MGRRQGSLAKFLDQYTCVRLVKLWGVDLRRFQFDTNLTWAVVLMSPDGKVLGRYGAIAADQDQKGTAQVNVNAVSVKGFEKFLEAGLDTYKKIKAGNKKTVDGIVGKQARANIWKKASEMPSISESFKKGDVTLSGCLHCHNVGSGRVKSMWLKKNSIDDKWLFPFPEPELLGFSLDVDQMATVLSVSPRSSAQKAGFNKGDRIILFGGQVPLSPADVRWVLHHAKSEAVLTVRVERGESVLDLKLALPKNFRRDRSLITASLTDLKPGFGIKAWHGNGDGGLFVVTIPGWWGKNDGYHVTGKRRIDVRKAGLKDGDVVLSVNGLKKWRHEADFIAWFWQKVVPGSTLTLQVRRDDKELTINIPLPKSID